MKQLQVAMMFFYYKKQFLLFRKKLGFCWLKKVLSQQNQQKAGLIYFSNEFAGLRKARVTLLFMESCYHFWFLAGIWLG